MGLGLILLSLLSVASRLLPATPAEHYLFARQYNARDNTVTIRQFWPQVKGYHCKRHAIDWRTLASLTYTLNREWPSEHRTSYANRRLWSQEWQQHGTCTGLSPFEYFSTIIDLHAEYDISEALQQDDVSTLSIAEDVQRAYGVLPVVHEMKKHDNRFEIWMCFDKSLNAMECSTLAQKLIWTDYQ